MRLQDVQRLSRLIHEHKRALRRAASLERRTLALLAERAPADTALRETTLAHLQMMLMRMLTDAGVAAVLAAYGGDGELVDDDQTEGNA